MTEEEWKEIEDLVGKINTGKYRCGMAAQSCLLAAYRELKERREDEEWLKRYNCTIGFGWDGVFVQQYVGGRNGKEGQGPTIHQAIQNAKNNVG